MGKTKWNDHMVAVLCELYPVETTFYTAQVLGMSETAVKNKAKELGIVKFAKSLRMKRAAHIGSHFHTCSFSEMGKELGISKTSVSRIAGQLGLKRSRTERHDITSRVRSDMIHRERRRVIFGLEPVTRIKVVSNRARVRLRSQLKRKGYTVGGERNTLYYAEGFKRSERQEMRGIKLGLKFLPLSTNVMTVSTII